MHIYFSITMWNSQLFQFFDVYQRLICTLTLIHSSNTDISSSFTELGTIIFKTFPSNDKFLRDNLTSILAFSYSFEFPFLPFNFPPCDAVYLFFCFILRFWTVIWTVFPSKRPSKLFTVLSVFFNLKQFNYNFLRLGFIVIFSIKRKPHILL